MVSKICLRTSQIKERKPSAATSWLLFPISSKGSFICTIPQPLFHQLWSTGSMGPPGGTGQITNHTMGIYLYHGSICRSLMMLLINKQIKIIINKFICLLLSFYFILFLVVLIYLLLYFYQMFLYCIVILLNSVLF